MGRPFQIVRDGDHTYTWWHTRIAEHLAAQWRARPEGCHCENTKIWPYCLADAGLGEHLELPAAIGPPWPPPTR